MTEGVAIIWLADASPAVALSPLVDGPIDADSRLTAFPAKRLAFANGREG